MSHAALKHYAAVRVQITVNEATPHQLTALLFDGALERIARAKGHLQRGELAPKGELISAVIAIVGELAGSLNRAAAPDLVDRLAALYDYILRRLGDANASNRIEPLDEAGRLLGTLAEAWRAIDPCPAVGSERLMPMPDLDAAIELTAAMWLAADAEDWDTVAALAGARHTALETALAGGAAGLESGAIDQLRNILAADQQLAARAHAARQQTATALRDLRGRQRMHSAYATQAVAG